MSSFSLSYLLVKSPMFWQISPPRFKAGEWFLSKSQEGEASQQPSTSYAWCLDLERREDDPVCQMGVFSYGDGSNCVKLPSINPSCDLMFILFVPGYILTHSHFLKMNRPVVTWCCRQKFWRCTTRGHSKWPLYPLVYSHWITPNWKFWNAGWIVYTQALSKAGVPLTTGWVIRKSYAQNLLFKSCYYDWCASAISASGFLEDAFTVYFCVGESTRHEDLWNEYGYSHINHNCPHHNHHMPLTCHCLVDHIHGFGWVTVEP
jgi:hypothetical protein